VTGFERWLCRHPKTASVCGGLLCFAIVLALSGKAMMAQLGRDLEGHQDRLAVQIRVMADENAAISDRLLTGYSTECTPQNLARMNALLFEYQTQRDIGIYDKDGRVYCTASMGLLSQPVADKETRYVNRRGGKAWVNTQTPASGGRGTLVMGLGGFNIAMSPSAIANITHQSDVAWLGGDSTPVYVRKGTPDDLLNVIRGLEASGESGQTVLWDKGVMVSLRRIDGTLVRVANYRYFSNAIIDNPVLAGLLLALSIGFGLLAKASLKPWIARRTSLRRLLPSLLTSGNLRCVYQPVVDLATGRPIACEVLVRLQNEDTLLYPDSFIRLVQELGLEWQMDSAVIVTALGELKRLSLPQSGFGVAFNLLPASVCHDRITALFAEQHAREDMPRGIAIGLELTEYHFSDALIPELHALRDLGYHIAVDDFGTGYSNLNTVRKVAPDLLKIDKSFVFDMEDDSARSSLIPEMVAIARAVNAKVVAEGVEDARQAEQLAALGVTYGQGYYFARPLSLSDFADYLRSHGILADTLAA